MNRTIHRLLPVLFTALLLNGCAGGSEWESLAQHKTASKFGYHDFVPMFTAEHFNAAEWAELFEKAGARFAGPVAEHHDGFSMWDSEVTPWNAMDKGPGRDITGELAKELRSRDYWNSHYPFYENMPPSSDDPKLSLLNGNMTEELFLERMWYGRLKEVIDKYQPDIIWFDSWLDQIPESYRKKFSAFYLNEAEKWDKEVVIVRKQDDLEKSSKNELDENVNVYRIKTT